MAPKPTCTIHTSLLNFWSLFPITHRMCPFRNSTDTNQYVQSQIHLSLKLDPSPDFSFSIKNSVLRAIAKFIIFSISVLSYPVPWKQASTLHNPLCQALVPSHMDTCTEPCRFAGHFHNSGSQPWQCCLPEDIWQRKETILIVTSGAPSTGIPLVEARDTDKHLTLQKPVPTLHPQHEVPWFIISVMPQLPNQWQSNFFSKYKFEALLDFSPFCLLSPTTSPHATLASSSQIHHALMFSSFRR